jgi:hypothetical protein
MQRSFATPAALLARALAALLLAALIAPAPAISAPPATMPLAPELAPFAWLASGAWRADLSALPGGTKLVETRYDVAPNGVIRFTTAFVRPDGSIANGYAGVLFYDAAAKHLTMWYTDPRGEVVQGPVTLNGDVWSMTFTSDGAVIGKPGPANFRVDVARRSNDDYHWTLLADAGGGVWKPVFALDYLRSAA